MSDAAIRSGRGFTAELTADFHSNVACPPLHQMVHRIQRAIAGEATRIGIDPHRWIVRRTLMWIHNPIEECLSASMSFWADGGGATCCWWAAEVTDRGEGRVECRCLLVHVDDAGRPARLPRGFRDAFPDLRRIESAELRFATPEVPPDARRRFWTPGNEGSVRINNASLLQAVEAARRDVRGSPPRELDIVYGRQVASSSALEIRSIVYEETFTAWLAVDDAVCATARITG